MRITIIGSGYVGLVTAAGLAETGADVVCMDIDSARTDALRAGRIPFHEPGLDELIARNRERLRFVSDMAEVVDTLPDVTFVCVGTPSAPNGSADLSAVDAACCSFAQHASERPDAPWRSPILAIKSTVPPGTCDAIEKLLHATVPWPRIEIVSTPEFLKEGSAVHDFRRPDVVVVGRDPRSAAIDAIDRTMRELYAPCLRTHGRLILTDRRSSEMAKYAVNSALAVRISHMNDVAMLCDLAGADADIVRTVVGSDERIGPRFLFPGVGFGGSCLPKDTRAMIAMARRHDVRLPMVEAALDANRRQADMFCAMADKALFGSDAPIAVWGLAFKPGTDDVREAPALVLVRHLLGQGVTVRVHDPKAMDAARRALADVDGPRLEWAEDRHEALEGAGVLALLTEWPVYRSMDWRRVAETMAGPGAVLDGRNIWDPEVVRAAGLSYRGVGRR